MKKTLLVLTLVFLFAFVLSTSTAFAGGWFKASGGDSQADPGDITGLLTWRDFNATSAVTPHLGFSSTSNLCRTCHAVHEAGDNSYRLLKNGTVSEGRSSGELAGENGMGNKRSTECMYCHDADSGASSFRPYGFLFGKTIRGEHTLGATWIPDSSVNEATATKGDGKGSLPRKEIGASDAILDCYQCHTVHGANKLTNIIGFGWSETQPIDNYILRNDPAGNGGDANSGINSILPPWDSVGSANAWKDGRSKDTTTYPSVDATPYAQGSIWRFEVQAAWCGDCHNDNPNISGPGDFRPNGKSHPLFGGLDVNDASNSIFGGYMEVNSTTIQVSGGAPRGCAQCHLSGTGVNATESLSWPHQAEGTKFLGENTTEHPLNPNSSFQPVTEGGSVSGALGDANRVISNMDRACLWCHTWDKNLPVVQGVGNSF